jgi:hypothetical protein
MRTATNRPITAYPRSGPTIVRTIGASPPLMRIASARTATRRLMMRVRSRGESVSSAGIAT